jgi:hypothetical protein
MFIDVPVTIRTHGRHREPRRVHSATEQVTVCHNVALVVTRSPIYSGSAFASRLTPTIRVLLPVARGGWWQNKRTRCLLRWLLLATARLLIRRGCRPSTVGPGQGMHRPRGGGPTRTNRLCRPEPGPALSKISSWSEEFVCWGDRSRPSQTTTSPQRNQLRVVLATNHLPPPQRARHRGGGVCREGRPDAGQPRWRGHRR